MNAKNLLLEMVAKTQGRVVPGRQEQSRHVMVRSNLPTEIARVPWHIMPLFLLQNVENGRVTFGTFSALVQCLVDPDSMDPTFAEDFMISYRTFASPSVSQIFIFYSHNSRLVYFFFF